MHDIADKAEVAIDFPDKFYIGGFGRDCGFEAGADDSGFVIRLVRPVGDKRVVELHLHHLLFADVLDEIAGSLAAQPPIEAVHRERLVKAARNLAGQLQGD